MTDSTNVIAKIINVGKAATVKNDAVNIDIDKLEVFKDVNGIVNPSPIDESDPEYISLRDLNPSNCKWEWIIVNGIKGYKVTSKKAGYTNSSIFLPAAGGCGYLYFSMLGESARYWASTMNLATRTRNADYLYFNESRAELSNGVKYLGQPIRPVKQ